MLNDMLGERIYKGLEYYTSYVWPPIPNRNFDWAATFVDLEEMGSGYGKTEDEAIKDLIELAELKDIL